VDVWAVKFFRQADNLRHVLRYTRASESSHQARLSRHLRKLQNLINLTCHENLFILP
jgi:hypothetical protein